MESALRTLKVYEQLIQPLGGWSRLGPVLDFGSGYGRRWAQVCGTRRRR